MCIPKSHKMSHTSVAFASAYPLQRRSRAIFTHGHRCLEPVRRDQHSSFWWMTDPEVLPHGFHLLVSLGFPAPLVQCGLYRIHQLGCSPVHRPVRDLRLLLANMLVADFDFDPDPSPKPDPRSAYCFYLINLKNQNAPNAPRGPRAKLGALFWPKPRKPNHRSQALPVWPFCAKHTIKCHF